MTPTHWLPPEVLTGQVPMRMAPGALSLRLVPEPVSMQPAAAAVHSRKWRRVKLRVPARPVNVRARGTPSPHSTDQLKVHQLRSAGCYSASPAYVLPLGAARRLNRQTRSPLVRPRELRRP